MRYLCALLIAASALAADLDPFTLPWNDATPVFNNLRSWQQPEAGIDGRVVVSPEGHYAINGNRVRFLGVNITAADCFPTADRAEGVARRLSRFGINAVRFHHMEAPWDKSNVLVNYAAGTSRELSTQRLDRLHYFISQLASQGIYTNLNLLVSREFQRADGLGPEITQLGWKDQHVLGFFLDSALDLHKEYARKLLTAPNPYRNNTPLGADPAVAFVEIMNENGLLQKWFEGVLDTLPATYKAALENRWNDWLAARYATFAELQNAWGIVDQPLGDNTVRNPKFAAGTGSWNMERHNGAAASFIPTTDFNGDTTLRIEVTNPGDANWHVQLNQAALKVENGGVYTVSFWAKAASPTPLSAGIQRAHTDYISLGPSINTTLTTDWKQYTLTYSSGYTESNARINFNGFGDRRATVWITDVRVQTGGRLGALPEGRTLESRNIPSVLRQGAAPTAAQQRDWVRFIFALEENYWTAMNRYLKDDLGFGGIVWGTIISNSAPGTMASLDAMDSHAYWQHPSFPPGLDFNSEQWSIPNTPMVNDASGGNISGIARQRVKGKPHNVTEYQHSAPNQYNSEMPILAAAYGALQDWDSIWYFEYNTRANEFTTGWFDTGGDPGKMATNIIAASIFLRGDVAVARDEYTMALPTDLAVQITSTRGGQWNILSGSQLGVPAKLAMVSRLSLSLNDEGLTTAPPSPTGATITSDTGELVWDTTNPSKGVVTVNTARSKAVVGARANRTYELGELKITPGMTRLDFSSIGITLLEGNNFTEGGRALIVAAGDHANAGMQWNAARTSVNSKWGTSPTLIETIPATFDLSVDPSRVELYTLNEKGERRDSVPVTSNDGRTRFELGTSGPTLWYELVIKPAPASAAADPAQSARPARESYPGRR